MRHITVRMGIRLISAGVALIILATYFNEMVTRFFDLSETAQYRFVLFGLVWGAILGCAGTVAAVIGFLAGPREEDGRGVGGNLLLLAVFIVMFFLLFLLREERRELPRLRPGETITI